MRGHLPLCIILFRRKASPLAADSFLVEIAVGNPYRAYQNPESTGMVSTYLCASVFKHNHYFLILAIIRKLFMLHFSHVKYDFRMAG